MTEQIKQPIPELRKVVVVQPAIHHPLPKAATKPLRQPSKSKAGGIAAILVMAIYLSAHSGYLFFKELLLACSIIGMAILLGTFGEPKDEATQSQKFDPRLN